MNISGRETVERIFAAVIEQTHAGIALRRHLAGTSSGGLIVGGDRIDLPDAGCYVIAIGKAAVEMAAAVEDMLGDALVRGIAVTKTPRSIRLARTSVVLGSHPVPDERSLIAGEAVLSFARSIPADALVLCLISGGGSALAERLHGSVDIATLQRVTLGLLEAGASIQELNAVRRRLSTLKAGGLLNTLAHTTVINLIVSDVLGNDPRTIASGPTVPPDDRASADDILHRYGVAVGLPPSCTGSVGVWPRTDVIADVRLAVDVAASSAAAHGFEPVVLTVSLDGEARWAGRMMATVAADARARVTSLAPPVCVIAGGEPTVTVLGAGAGGRNTEAALAAALRLSGVDDVTFASLATDGDDASTGAAGAIVSGATITDATRRDAMRALAANDSWTFLDSIGCTLVTGPTGTNVNDLMIALVR